MKRGRTLALAGALSLVALGAGTMVAHAANDITGQFDAPAANFEFTTASTNMRGHFSMPNGGTINNITVTVKTPDGQNIGQSFDSPSNGSFDWTPAAWRLNGAYTATAVGNGRTSDVFNPQNVSTQATVTYYVSAPPQTPTGVDASVDDAKRIVTVSWNPNPEPDIDFYVVGRYVGSSSSGRAFFFDPSQTNFVDNLGSAPAGVYHYDVYAVRKAGKPGEKSIASKSAGSTTATVRSAPPTTSTSTPAGGGTGSGSGAGSGSGSGSSSTSPTIAQRGSVDLSGFGNLLAQGGGLPSRASATPTPTDPDPGFNESLPYGARPSTPGPSNNDTALGTPSTQRLADSKERPTSLLFLAAGLLATVLLMHLLWVKSEVDRAPLDPLPAPTPRPQPRTRRREPRLP